MTYCVNAIYTILDGRVNECHCYPTEHQAREYMMSIMVVADRIEKLDITDSC